MGFLRTNNQQGIFDTSRFGDRSTENKLASTDTEFALSFPSLMNEGTNTVLRGSPSPEDVIASKRTEYNLLQPIEGLGKYYFRMRFADYKRPTTLNADTDTFNTDFEAILPLPITLTDKAQIDFMQADMSILGDLGAGLEQITNTLRSESATGEDIRRSLEANIGGLGPSAANRLFYNIMPQMLQNIPVAGQIFRNADILLQQSFGSLPNPNASLALSGLPLRTWQYTWMFLPHDEEESRKVQRLIKELKNRSLPFTQKISTNQEAITGLLGYPQMVLVNMYPWDKNGQGLFEHSDQSLVKSKRMMIRDVMANYNTEGQPQYFKGTNLPVSVQVSIVLQEVEYFLSEDEPLGEGNERVYPEAQNVAQDVADSLLATGKQLANQLGIGGPTEANDTPEQTVEGGE